jgi:hypothetical protein
MLDVLRVLDKAGLEGMTPNAIGTALDLPRVFGGRGAGGRGRGHRTFGPAQRVIFTLTRLRDLGLVDYGPRADGRTGTQYFITDAGQEALEEIEE